MDKIDSKVGKMLFKLHFVSDLYSQFWFFSLNSHTQLKIHDMENKPNSN